MKVIGHTEVIMRDAQVKEGASGTLDFDATLVQFHGATNVTFL